MCKSFVKDRKKMLLPILLAIFACVGASEVSLDEFSNGFSSFASDFYQETVQPENNNVIVSPYSVASALAYLAQGADGNSFEQIKSGLHLKSGKSEMADNYQQYHGLLEGDAGAVPFSIANQLFVQQGYTLKKDFQEVATKKFFSGVENVDFSKNTEAAATINHFVAEKTNNKINDLVSANSFSKDSRVVLINAIHMKAKWDQPFEKHNTNKQDFYVNEEEKTNVDFMHATKRFNYGVLTDLDASALEMKYAQSNLSMLVVLPNTRTGLNQLETKLKTYDLMSVFDQMSGQPVKVTMPKFKIEHKVNLNDVLKRMGMSDIFNDEKANLSGLLDSTEPLVVSDVIHKAFIEVEETGTEAAAATAIIVNMARSGGRYLTFEMFTADHPFVYYIFDRKLKMPIFSGHITRLE